MSRLASSHAARLRERQRSHAVVAASVAMALALTALGGWTLVTGPNPADSAVADTPDRHASGVPTAVGCTRSAPDQRAPRSPDRAAETSELNPENLGRELQLWYDLAAAFAGELDWNELAQRLTAEEFGLFLSWYATGEPGAPAPGDPREID